MSNIIETKVVLTDEASASIAKLTDAITQLTDNLQKVGEGTKPANANLKETVDIMGELERAALKFVGFAAVKQFLTSAVTESIEAEEAIRHLNSQLKVLGTGMSANTQEIDGWVKAMSELAHVEDDVVYESLGKAIKRTGDLTTSMQLVQLAQDIVIAQGGELGTVLNMLTMAAGGTQRAMSMLQRDFGQQLIGVTDVREAVAVLAKNYGGTAIAAKSLQISITDASLAFKEMKQMLGDQLSPAIDLIVTKVFLPFITEVTRMGISVKTFSTAAVASLIAIPTIAAAGWGNYAAVGKEQLGILDAIFKEGSEETRKLYEKNIEDLKNNLKDTGKIDIKPGQKDIQETQEALSRQLEMVKQHQSVVLANIYATEEMKLEAIRETANQEEKITWALGASKKQTYAETAQQVAIIEENAQVQMNQVRQQGSERWRVDLVNYANKVKDVNSQVVGITIKTIDGISSGFGDAFAKMLVSGESFTKNFAAAFKSLAISVLSDITAMIMKMLILRSIASISGGPVLGFMPFAEGGRVTKPTLALIGEGGEPETVVPDSKRQAFAAGVMGSRGGSGSVVVNMGGFNFTISGGTQSTDIPGLMQQIAEYVKNETIDGIRFALINANTASRNSMRSV